MPKMPTITVIIPCYRETAHVLDVIGGVGDEVAHIIVVDDACPDKTGEHVKANCDDGRVQVVVHELNTGVGGATLSGYRRALEVGSDIVVKVDGDGQMDPVLIPTLVKPIADGQADYTKGNRFHQLQAISDMPAMRITGNMMLSLASKLSSGYWDIFDTTNGYTAIHAGVLPLIPLDSISKGYFFESDMLFRLGQIRAVVRDIPMQARYGSEKSALSIPKIIPEFLFKHYINTCKRIYHAYFVREFNFASIQLVWGCPAIHRCVSPSRIFVPDSRSSWRGSPWLCPAPPRTSRWRQLQRSREREQPLRGNGLRRLPSLPVSRGRT